MSDTYAPWRQEGMTNETNITLPEHIYYQDVAVMCVVTVRCMQTGTYAEYICVNEDQLARMPDSMSFEDAAALPLVTLTAWQVTWAFAFCHLMSGVQKTFQSPPVLRLQCCPNSICVDASVTTSLVQQHGPEIPGYMYPNCLQCPVALLSCVY